MACLLLYAVRCYFCCHFLLPVASVAGCRGVVGGLVGCCCPGGSWSGQTADDPVTTSTRTSTNTSTSASQKPITARRDGWARDWADMVEWKEDLL